jgi:hypothetical protein
MTWRTGNDNWEGDGHGVYYPGICPKELSNIKRLRQNSFSDLAESLSNTIQRWVTASANLLGSMFVVLCPV